MWQPPWHFLAQAQGRIKRADLYPPHLLPDDVLIVIVCWSALTIRQASGATELGQLAIIALVITALAVFRMQYNRLAYEAPIYFVGCIPSLWFFQRSWQTLSPLIS